MKKILYFVLDFETKTINEDEKVLTGNAAITAYDIENNVPKKFCTIDYSIGDNVIDKLQDYLNDNRHGDKNFEFIQL